MLDIRVSLKRQKIFCDPAIVPNVQCFVNVYAAKKTFGMVEIEMINHFALFVLLDQVFSFTAISLCEPKIWYMSEQCVTSSVYYQSADSSISITFSMVESCLLTLMIIKVWQLLCRSGNICTCFLFRKVKFSEYSPKQGCNLPHIETEEGSFMKPVTFFQLYVTTGENPRQLLWKSNSTLSSKGSENSNHITRCFYICWAKQIVNTCYAITSPALANLIQWRRFLGFSTLGGQLSRQMGALGSLDKSRCVREEVLHRGDFSIGRHLEM